MPHIRESNTVLDSGFFLTGIWIPDSSRSLDSGFQELNSGSYKCDDQHFREIHSGNFHQDLSLHSIAMKLIEPSTHVQIMEVERLLTENLTRRASKREKYMALIFIL